MTPNRSTIIYNLKIFCGGGTLKYAKNTFEPVNVSKNQLSSTNPQFFHQVKLSQIKLISVVVLCNEGFILVSQGDSCDDNAIVVSCRLPFMSK